jgi:hypothetical protein
LVSTQASATNPAGVDYDNTLWEADWLHRYHPYIEDLARCAPRQPVPLIDYGNPDTKVDRDILFWNPALEQTVAVTDTYVCDKWPDATLYTIHDRNRLSRVYAAQIRGAPWQPSLPPEQWSRSACGNALELPPLWKWLRATVNQPGHSTDR